MSPITVRARKLRWTVHATNAVRILVQNSFPKWPLEGLKKKKYVYMILKKLR
jgi:hypothetical protein